MTEFVGSRLTWEEAKCCDAAPMSLQSLGGEQPVTAALVLSKPASQITGTYLVGANAGVGYFVHSPIRASLSPLAV